MDNPGRQAYEILKAARDPIGLTVLRFTCGKGVVFDHIKQNLQTWSPDQFHCIDFVSRSVPESESASKVFYQIHTVRDPIRDFPALSTGELREKFDVVSTDDYWHHATPIPFNARLTVFVSVCWMLKPAGKFLFHEWNSAGPPLVTGWYDTAHLLFEVVKNLQSPKNEAELDVGTKYKNIEEWKAQALQAGLVVTDMYEDVTSPVGLFLLVFQREAYIKQHSQNLQAVRRLGVFDITHAWRHRHRITLAGLWVGVSLSVILRCRRSAKNVREDTLLGI